MVAERMEHADRETGPAEAWPASPGSRSDSCDTRLERAITRTGSTGPTDARAEFFAHADAVRRRALAARVDLGVSIGGVNLATPVMPASGCFGPVLGGLMPVSTMGAAVTKTVFLGRRPGNPEPRVSDRGGVMVNSVGIPSEGLEAFRRHVLPAYRDLGCPVIVSVGGLRPGDYPELIARLAPEGIDGFELNISCPNLDAGGDEFGADPGLVETITAACVRACALPVITKLPPMVNSIAVLARAAEAGGASAVTVANSFPGYLLATPRKTRPAPGQLPKGDPSEPATRRPALGNGIGGVSGPPLRPLALRLIKQASAGASLPVVACGGIATADDVLDAMALGACAAQIGTATFATPHVIAAIACELMERCVALHARSIRDLIEEVR